MSQLYPNGHSLYRITDRGSEPCWRIAYLADMNARLTDEQKAQYDGVSNGDFPNGLIHDETCRTCRGTNIQLTTVVVGYSCAGCDMRGDHELFDTTSCLMLGAGSLIELRAEHDAGEHAGLSYTRCPLCAEDRMRMKEMT